MPAPPATSKAMEEREIVQPAASPAHPPISRENRKRRLTAIRAAMKCRWQAVLPPAKCVRRTRSWTIDRVHSSHFPPGKSVLELRLQTNEYALQSALVSVHYCGETG